MPAKSVISCCHDKPPCSLLLNRKRCGYYRDIFFFASVIFFNEKFSLFPKVNNLNNKLKIDFYLNRYLIIFLISKSSVFNKCFSDIKCAKNIKFCYFTVG